MKPLVGANGKPKQAKPAARGRQLIGMQLKARQNRSTVRACKLNQRKSKDKTARERRSMIDKLRVARSEGFIVEDYLEPFPFVVERAYMVNLVGDMNAETPGATSNNTNYTPWRAWMETNDPGGLSAYLAEHPVSNDEQALLTEERRKVRVRRWNYTPFTTEPGKRLEETLAMDTEWSEDFWDK